MRYCVIVMSCNVGSQGHNETADDCLLNPSPAERVCYSVQLPTSAVNVTLLAFTAGGGVGVEFNAPLDTV